MKTKSHLCLQLPTLAAGVMLLWMTSATAAQVQKDDQPADTTAQKDVITATGTVFSVEPELLSVVMKDNPAPLRFSYDKSTAFLDEAGAVVPMDLIRPDLPLTVHYAMEGEKMVARKVVLTRSMIAGDANEKPGQKRAELAEAKAVEMQREAETEINRPQTLMGTVSTVEQTISLVLRGETRPVSCIINNSTRYINQSGQPVSSALVMSGMPITVRTVQDGHRVVAQEIILRGNSAPAATEPGAVAAGQETGGQDGRRGSQRGNTNGGGNNVLPVPGFIPGNGGAGIPLIPNNPSVSPSGDAGNNNPQPPAASPPGGNGPRNPANKPNPDNKPADNKPADNKPADNRPAPNKPAGNNPPAPAQPAAR